MPAYILPYDKILVAAQRGDQEMAPSKPPQLRLWNGMVGNLIDPHTFNQKVVLSHYNQGEALWIELPRSELPKVQAMLNPVGDDQLKTTYRRTSAILDYNALAPYLLATTPDLLSKIHVHKQHIPVIKLNSLPINTITDSTRFDLKRPLIADVGQITTGNFTIGPVGADYPTFGGVGGFAAALGNLTGNLTGTQIGNITEVATALYTITLGGFTLEQTSNNPPQGDPTAGHLIIIGGDIILFHLQHEGPGFFLHHNMHTRSPNFLGAGRAHLAVQSINVASTIRIYDNFFNGLNRSRPNVSIIDNTPIIQFYNNVLWDALLIGFLSSVINAASLIENNAAYSCASTGFNLSNQACTCRNNAAYSCGITDFVNTAAATGRYNRSSDLTAADVNWGAGFGNTTGAVVLADVLGTNDAVANFFDLIPGGPLDGAGEANAIAARLTCIRNRVVPGPLGTSVGVAESPTAFQGNYIFDRKYW